MKSCVAIETFAIAKGQPVQAIAPLSVAAPAAPIHLTQDNIDSGKVANHDSSLTQTNHL
jgi:hypothetical protein